MTAPPEAANADLDSLLLAGLAAAPQAILLVDRALTVRYLNGAAQELLGIGLTRARGQTLGRTPHLRTDRLAAIAAHAGKGRTPVTAYDVTIGDHAGPVDATAVPAGDHLLLILAGREVADRAHAEEQRQGTARAIGNVAAVLAHEIKNPLAGIRGAAQLLRQSIDGEEDAALCTLIYEETARIAGWLDRIEAFAADAPPRFASLNIHEVLDHVRRAVLAGTVQEVSIAPRYDPSLPDLPGDRDLLIQALLNLVKNAAEAAGPGGCIELVTAYRPATTGGLTGGPAIGIDIRDNGPGLGAEEAARLFEPFASTKGGGRGLGLPFAAKVVSDHGGQIDVMRERGWTVFRLVLPLTAPAGAREERGAE